MKPDETALIEDAIDPEHAEEFVTIPKVELEMLRAVSREVTERTFLEPSPKEPKADRELSNIEHRDLGLEARLRKELVEREGRLASLERKLKDAIRDRELATMLAGKPLVAGAAAQLIRLWRDEFDVFEEDGTLKVAARDGRKPTQVVNEWLASADYSHFCLPTSRGGTGAKDTTRPASEVQIAETPKNLGEAIIMKWRQETDARVDKLSKPIGLKRRR